MRGAVWGSTFKIASSKLNEVIEQYTLYRIPPKKLVKTKYNHWVEFENGDIWRACPANENMRGMRANISYIDYLISPIFVDTIIKPCTTSYPFQAIHYYWPREDEDD